MSSADDDRIAANVAQWTLTNREHTNKSAERSWYREELEWGVFSIPDRWVGDPAGLDVVELGCGTAYESAWFARNGARPVGVDPTPAQLATARRMQQETRLEFPLIEAPAESVPLPDASFDLAFSEYGASLWADPEKWIAEAARLLRPDGRLFFLTMSTLAHLCTPDQDNEQIRNELVRAQFAPWEVRWEGYSGAEFHLSHGDWIRVLRANGFRIDALHELQAPADATTHEYYLVIPADWARQWPGEDLWECTNARRLDGARRVAKVPALPAPERVPDTIAANIADWTQANAEHTDASAEKAWAHQGILWGVFAIPEEQVGALPESVDGLDVVELGCGTAYFGSWLQRRGARVTGVDPTPVQLATARRMMAKTGIEFPLVEAPGEAVPLPDAAYDLAVSEYGASLWADPYHWVPEAARLLRTGGLLVFLVNSTLVYLCAPDGDGVVGQELQREQFGMYRIQWDGAIGVEYHLAHGDWIELLRENGLEVEALHELRPQPGAVDPAYYDFVTVEWAEKWPAEEIWVARKT